jgi:short-subunit dehydrogenase
MRVLIIGGTTGIGWALAKHYLQAGHAVAVCGRDISKVDLDTVKHASQLQQYVLDITDNSALASVIHEYARDTLDLLIVSAGFYFNNRHHLLDQASTLRMLRTNISGMNDAFSLCAEIMLAQKSGHLVAIASVAGLLKDYPSASLYSACKRSVIQLCESYRIALQPFGIHVTTVIPGYIDTKKLRELNNGDASRKPFLLSEHHASMIIAKAIEEKKAACVFPWQMRCLIWLLNLLPRYLLSLRS